MTVKDNHPLLRKKIERFFESPGLFVTPSLPLGPTLRTGHGRVEERHLVASADVPPGYLDWPHVGQVWRLTRTTTRAGVGHTETVYGITSLTPAQAGPARLLSLVRGHWQIETRSHWVRDVTFDEDHSQTRCGGIPQVMAAVRNACIGLMRAAGHTNIAAACRFHAAQPQAALRLLGIPRTE
jgi:hypothetical protein